MEKELAEFFKGKQVKIKYYNDFSLTGTILEVYDTTILFKTTQKTSAISLTEIKTIIGSGY